MVSGIIASFASSTLLSWGASRNREGLEVENQRIVGIFNEMRRRMGMENDPILLRAISIPSGMRASGLSALGFHGQISVNMAVVSSFSDEVLRAVFAHELAHIKHYDSARLAGFLFVSQVVSYYVLLTFFSLTNPLLFLLSGLGGLASSVFVYSPRIELHADEEGMKVLTENEIRAYIQYLGAGNARRVDYMHPHPNDVVAMLRQELINRGLPA